MSLFVAAAFVCAQATAPDLKVMVDNVAEMRTSSNCCPSLAVNLKLTGTDMSHVAGVLPFLETATSNGGQDLTPEVDPDQYMLMNQYEEFRGTRGKPVEIRLAPVRRDATSVTVKGKLQVFMPPADYKPLVVATDFLKQSGVPIAHPELKKRGISIVAFTKADYEKYAEEQKSAAKSGSGGTAGALGALGEAFGDVLSSLFAGFGGDGDATVLISDPKDQLLGIRFVDANSQEIKTVGRSGSYMKRHAKFTYSFGGKPLDGIGLAVDFIDSTGMTPIQFDLTADLP